MNARTLSLSAGLLSLVFAIPACKKDKGAAKDELRGFGSCQPVSAKGNLTYSANTGYIFRTSGGGIITIDLKKFVTVTDDNYPGFKFVMSGGSEMNGQLVYSYIHEYLNGKHIKDRSGSRRTIVLPDGAKVTMIADGRQGALQSISIYNGSETHHINVTCNTLEYSSANSAAAPGLDDDEADGETSTYEISSTGLILVNIYLEDTPGDKVMNRVLLGELYRDSPTKVDDYYDDPLRDDT